MDTLDAKLVFDSEQTGDDMGARAVVGSDRSLLFTAGSMMVDLVVYSGTDDMRVVHGQLVDRSSEAPIAGARVCLGAEDDAVETDEFGQFHLSTMLPFSQAILTITAEQGDVRCAIPAACVADGAAS